MPIFLQEAIASIAAHYHYGSVSSVRRESGKVVVVVGDRDRILSPQLLSEGFLALVAGDPPPEPPEVPRGRSV